MPTPSTLSDKDLAMQVKQALRGLRARSKSGNSSSTFTEKALYAEQEKRMRQAWKTLRSKSYDSRQQLTSSPEWVTLATHVGGNIPGKVEAVEYNAIHGDGKWHAEALNGLGAYLMSSSASASKGGTDIKASNRAAAVIASSRRVRYLRRKYGPQVAATPPAVGTELQGMHGKRCTLKGIKAGRAMLSDGRNVSVEQLTRDFGWSGKCSLVCSVSGADVSANIKMLEQAGFKQTGPLLWSRGIGNNKLSASPGKAADASGAYREPTLYLPGFATTQLTKANLDHYIQLYTLMSTGKTQQEAIREIDKGASNISASSGNRELPINVIERFAKDGKFEYSTDLKVGSHVEVRGPNGKKEWIMVRPSKTKQSSPSLSSISASSAEEQRPTGKLTCDFPDEAQARAFATKAMSLQGTRVSCSGKSVSVSYPAGVARSVIAAAHGSHVKAGAISAAKKDDRLVMPKPEYVDTRKTGDHGADPLGNGKFRMVPSGDVVDLEERNRRLEKKASTVKATAGRPAQQMAGYRPDVAAMGKRDALAGAPPRQVSSALQYSYTQGYAEGKAQRQQAVSKR